MHRNILATLPKVELHLHLEGSVPFKTLFKLIKKYDGLSEVTNLSDLEKKFKYKNFSHFIDTWIWKNGFLREYDDFTLISEEVARDLAKQNIRYAEIFYSPGDFSRHGLKPQELTKAIRKGLNR